MFFHTFIKVFSFIDYYENSFEFLPKWSFEVTSSSGRQCYTNNNNNNDDNNNNDGNNNNNKNNNNNNNDHDNNCHAINNRI